MHKIQTKKKKSIKEVKNMNVLTEFITMIFGCIVLGIMYLVWTKREVPFLSTPNQIFLLVLILGFLMCVLGLGPRLEWTGMNWIHPFILAGLILGLIIIVFTAVVALRIPMPFNLDESQRILILGTLIIGKWVVATIHLVNHLF